MAYGEGLPLMIIGTLIIGIYEIRVMMTLIYIRLKEGIIINKNKNKNKNSGIGVKGGSSLSRYGSNP